MADGDDGLGFELTTDIEEELSGNKGDDDEQQQPR